MFKDSLKNYFLEHPGLRRIGKGVAGIFVIAAIAMSAGEWFQVRQLRRQLQDPVVRIGIQNSEYHFINPLLAYDLSDNKDFFELKPLESKIIARIQDLQSQGKADAMGIYFRDFISGHWVGVHENDQFFPASLLKVPLMIAYFKESESQPDVLNKQLTYDGKQDANAAEVYKPVHGIQAGKSYTVEQLIEYMVKYSDNNAANLLVNNIDQNSFGDVYSDLGIQLPQNQQQVGDFLTPKQYSLFFRVLRNATYLNFDLSEKALLLLSQADFTGGMVKGLPLGTETAHKFGEYGAVDASGNAIAELHDCGIVYAQNHPYFLCVMTRGKDFTALEESIANISQLVYDQVIHNYK